MIGRKWIVAAAAGVALALLLITLLAGPPVQQEERRAISPIDPQFVPHLDEAARNETAPPFQEATHIQVRGRTETGDEVLFTADESKLLEDGELYVTDPRTLIHNKGGGWIEIRADTGWITDKGWILEPEDYPRLGRFEGHVVIAMHEAPSPEEPGGTAGSNPATLRIEMEDAHFDYDLFEISSDRSVLVDGREIEFEGSGLVVTFNELHDRIDKLVLHHGDFLRFRTAGLASHEVAPTPNAPTPDTPDAPTPPIPPAPTVAPQYYTARFDRDVVITSDMATINAKTLRAIFSLDMKAPGGGGAKSEERGAKSEVRGAGSGEAGADTPDGGLKARSAQGKVPAPAPAAAAQEVTIRWSGGLTIDPVDRPAELGPHDMLLSMSGSPVLMRTAEGDQLTADRASYLLSAEEIRLAGTHTNPLTVDSRELGTLRLAATSRMLINPQMNTGLLEGAGSLQTRQHRDEPIRKRPDHDVPAPQMAEDMKVSWTDRLELTFFAEKTPDAGDEEESVFGALRSAAFHGDVNVGHPAFDMKAHHIGIGMKRSKQGSPYPQTMRATGEVKVNVHDDPSVLPLSLETDELTLDTARDQAGTTYPARLRAVGHVEAKQQGMELDSGRLEVAMAPAKDGPPDTPTPGHEPGAPKRVSTPGGDDERLDVTPRRIRVTRMVAREDVNIRIESEGDRFIARAQQVIADVAKDQVELLGNRSEPARIATADGATAIESGYIVYDQKAETMQAVGPGTWMFRQIAADDTVQPDDEGVLAISWTKSMLYEHPSGKARFVGMVEAVARKDNETTMLTAGEMRLYLAAASPGDPEPGGAATARHGLAGGLDTSGRTIERVEAENDADKQVVFLATQWQGQIDGKVLTRLRIAGPKMVFDNIRSQERTVQQIRFIGRGTMQYEDYTPSAPPVQGITPDPNKITFAGRGVTAVEWKGELLLDALRNEMRIHDNVWLAHTAHRHLDQGEQPVQLECDRFVADLEDTGGLEAWTAGKATETQIRTVTADRGIIVTHGDMEIRSGMLKYTNDDQYITITPARGGTTFITSPDRTFTQGDPLKWNVETGTLVIGRSGIIREQVGE